MWSRTDIGRRRPLTSVNRVGVPLVDLRDSDLDAWPVFIVDRSVIEAFELEVEAEAASLLCTLQVDVGRIQLHSVDQSRW